MTSALLWPDFSLAPPSFGIGVTQAKRKRMDEELLWPSILFFRRGHYYVGMSMKEKLVWKINNKKEGRDEGEERIFTSISGEYDGSN